MELISSPKLNLPVDVDGAITKASKRNQGPSWVPGSKLAWSLEGQAKLKGRKPGGLYLAACGRSNRNQSPGPSKSLAFLVLPRGSQFLFPFTNFPSGLDFLTEVNTSSVKSFLLNTHCADVTASGVFKY